uniref:THH1/TOM1/TOM3 domain-containing protein n=1 Tax=Setaria italica TaxID=4555 RepID=K3ZGM6_SETIT
MSWTNFVYINAVLCVFIRGYLFLTSQPTGDSQNEEPIFYQISYVIKPFYSLQLTWLTLCYPLLM